MADIIPIEDRLERKRKRDFIADLGTRGCLGNEIGLWSEIYDAFFETEAQLTDRLEAEKSQRRFYVVKNLVRDQGELNFFLPSEIGLYHWVEVVKATVAEVGSPIKIHIPLVLGDNLPQQGYFCVPVTSCSDYREISASFQRKQEQAFLDYLESPEGRRMILHDTNRPEGKDWAWTVAYLRERCVPK